MADQRLARLEAALLRLRQDAAGALLLVEGRRDAAALERLGIGGEHATINRGWSLQRVADHLAEVAAGRRVLILVDWDRTGGRLAVRLHHALRARVRVDIENRRRVALASHAKCLEDVPGDLAALRRLATSDKG